LEFDFIVVRNHDTHDSLVDFSVVQVDADFFADLELTVILCVLKPTNSLAWM